MIKNLFTAIFFFWFCSLAFPKDNFLQIYSNKTKDGKNLSIKLEKGKFYNSAFYLGDLKVNITPQIAIWAEDETGKMLETLFVTDAYARQNWATFIKISSTETFRKETLPYWLNKYHETEKKMPTIDSPLPDSVTFATPFTSFVFYSKIITNKDIINLLLEINMAFDDNENFKAKTTFGNPVNSGTSAQPSVVYCATVDISKNGTYPMKLIGCGDADGANGELHNNINKLTTAKRIVNRIAVSIND